MKSMLARWLGMARLKLG